MLKILCRDYNLRGYTFEFISKIMLRRQRKNNFIFQGCQFDSVDEILHKYRLQAQEKVVPHIECLRELGLRCDLIEFVCTHRRIEKIIVYEVKTKHHKVKRDYFEMCVSNHKFFKRCAEKGIETVMISIILFEDWKFSFNAFPYKKARIQTYSNHKN